MHSRNRDVKRLQAHVLARFCLLISCLIAILVYLAPFDFDRILQGRYIWFMKKCCFRIRSSEVNFDLERCFCGVVLGDNLFLFLQKLFVARRVAEPVLQSAVSAVRGRGRAVYIRTAVRRGDGGDVQQKLL